MKRQIVTLSLLLCFIGFSYTVFSQGVAINNNGASPDASALLDVNGTNAGMLIPRLTLIQRNALVNPATSLIIFQTNNTTGYYYNSGTPAIPVWERLATGNDLGFVDGSGAATRVAFWQDANTLSSNANLFWDNANGRLGIGTSAPTQKLEVAGTTKANHFYTGYNWTSKSNGINLGVDGINGGIGFYDGSTPNSASIFREATTSNFYIGVRSGLVLNGITINSTGDIGIGTTTPSTKLHVNGTVRFQGLGTGTQTTSLMTDANGNISSRTLNISNWDNAYSWGNHAAAGYLTSFTEVDPTWNGTANQTGAIGRTGDVGIGTTSPTQKLHVLGNARVTGAYYDSNNTAGTSGQVLSSTVTGTQWAKGQIIQTNSASVTAGNWYRIASNSGDRADASFTLRDPISSGGHSTMRFYAGVNYGDASGISFSLLSHSKYGSVTFTKVRIVRNSTYDGAYLEVFCNRTGTVEYDMFDNYQSSGWTPVDWTAGSIPSGWTAHEYETDRLFAIGASDDILSLNRSGYLGIGTASPTYRLEVIGDIYANGGAVRISGNSELNFQSYGGGFYMQDATWIRTYGNKSFYHNSGEMRTDGTFQVGGSGSTLNVPNGGNFAYRTNVLFANTSGNVGIGTASPGYRLDLANGTFAFGNSNQRTETRDNAGLQGNAGAQSGFFETASPTNFPAGATSWWHLIDSRHSNTGNNYSMQLAGSFFDQKLYFRKTNNNAAQPWTEVLTGDYFDSNVVTVESTSTLSITSGTWTVIPGESITLNNLVAGDRVLIWFGGNMQMSGTDYNIVDVALFINGTLANVGGYVRTSIDDASNSYMEYINYSATARYNVTASGNYTFDVRACRLLTGNTIYIGGNSTDSREGVLTVFVIKN